MRPTPRKTALALIRKMRREVEDVHLPLQTMLDDIKMMQFKIRALGGDISLLTKQDRGFIEAIWKLGKMDEIIMMEAHTLSVDEQKIFFRYMQNRQHIPPMHHHGFSQTPILEIEIIKERKSAKQLIN